MKVKGILNHWGRPRSLGTHPANPCESTPVQLSLDLVLTQYEAAKLDSDKASNGSPQDATLYEEDIKMITPRPCNRRRPETQAGRRLRRTKRQGIVERFVGWMQWRRRLFVRSEHGPRNFLAFVQLLVVCIFFKHLGFEISLIGSVFHD